MISLTLFLAFVNDNRDLSPTGVHSAMQAVDLALWGRQESLAMACKTMQITLTKLEAWTKKCLLKLTNKINPYGAQFMQYGALNFVLKKQ